MFTAQVCLRKKTLYSTLHKKLKLKKTFLQTQIPHEQTIIKEKVPISNFKEHNYSFVFKLNQSVPVFM